MVHFNVNACKSCYLLQINSMPYQCRFNYNVSLQLNENNYYNGD